MTLAEMKEKYDDLLIVAIALRDVAAQYEERASTHGVTTEGIAGTLARRMAENGKRARRLLAENESQRAELSRRIREIEGRV